MLLLAGCASTDTIRGQLNFDLRPEGARADVVWPSAPDTPRYRYLGELIGEPNFVRSDKTQSTLTTAFNWMVGLFESYTPLLLQRPQHGTVSNSGRIFVVDPGRNAVLVFDPNPPAEGDSKSKEGHLLVWDLAANLARFEAPVAVAMAWNGGAIGLATKCLQALDRHSRDLLLLTDGANSTGTLAPLRAAWLAQRAGVRIHAVGIGAAPVAGTDARTSVADLDEATLQQIAEQSGGSYQRATDSAALAASRCPN